MAEPQEVAPPEPIMNGDEVDRMANGNAECEVMASEEVTVGYTLVVQMGNLTGQDDRKFYSYPSRLTCFHYFYPAG